MKARFGMHQPCSSRALINISFAAGGNSVQVFRRPLSKHAKKSIQFYAQFNSKPRTGTGHNTRTECSLKLAIGDVKRTGLAKFDLQFVLSKQCTSATLGGSTRAEKEPQ